LELSAKVMDRAFIVKVPSLARKPSTVISSPAFKLFFLQPRRASALGLPASQVHVKVDVRVHPIEFRHHAFKSEGGLLVVLGGKRVVRQRGERRQKAAGERSTGEYYRLHRTGPPGRVYYRESSEPKDTYSTYTRQPPSDEIAARR